MIDSAISDDAIPGKPDRQIFIDCTDTYIHGLNTGIQRVVRSIVLHADSAGARAVLKPTPIVFYGGRYHAVSGLNDRSIHNKINSLRRRLNALYLDFITQIGRRLPEGKFRSLVIAPRQQPGLAKVLYAPFALIAGIKTHIRPAAVAGAVDPSCPELDLRPGDIVFLPDASWGYDGWQNLARFRRAGAKLIFLVHDLIPLTHPHFFRPDHVARFRDWFTQCAAHADGFICNSHYTKTVLQEQMAAAGIAQGHIPVAVVLLGHDHESGGPRRVSHRRLARALKCETPKYFCVGTLEPRKNHALLLDAFELLWQQSSPARLILIGRIGWLSDAVVARILTHPELGHRLFWFRDVGDTDLAAAYHQADGLIFASSVEGFGLPIVEALSRGIPVIASDIEVFREIASNFAHFFAPGDSSALATVLARLPAADHKALPHHDFVWPDWQTVTRSMFDAAVRLADAQSRS